MRQFCDIRSAMMRLLCWQVSELFHLRTRAKPVTGVKQAIELYMTGPEKPMQSVNNWDTAYGHSLRGPRSVNEVKSSAGY